MGGSEFLVDLHVHTLVKSQDSSLDPAALIRRAESEGLSAICITDHNACWSDEETAELQKASSLPLLRGMEVGTSVGHVLAFGIPEFRREMWELDELRRAADREGGALVLAHPLRPPAFGRSWDELPGLFEGIEMINSDESMLVVDQVRELGERYSLALTGGSDAHSVAAVGRAATVFERPVTNDEELIKALKEGSIRPVSRA